MLFDLAPFLTEKDEADSAEGGIDPLGLYTIADTLGTRLVPGVRERQTHPRFVTAIAVSLSLCQEFDEEIVAADGSTPPWLVFEWHVIEGLTRTCNSEELRGVPGNLKVAGAIRDEVPVSATRYLKTPTVFGFHGIYRLLAKTLGIEASGRLGEVGFELAHIWAREQGLDGFVGSKTGLGQSVRRQLSDAIRDAMQKGAVSRSAGWAGWRFFHDHLRIYNAGENERRFLIQALLNNTQGFRDDVITFLVSNAGRKAWETESERHFHEALSKKARPELVELLETISLYEHFARLCQDAFDDCLYEMTCQRVKTSPQQLGRIESVKKASRTVPKIFGSLTEKLHTFGEDARFSDLFGNLAQDVSPGEWAELLTEHHRKIQRAKPPDGKNPWFDRFDDGSLIVRALYRRDTGGRNDDSFVHAYRTASLWSFANDLGQVKA